MVCTRIHAMAKVTGALCVLVFGTQPSFGESIRFESDTLTIQPGGQASLLVLLEQSSTPLFGYSLDLDIDSTPPVDGLSISTADTNFFDSRNLITAGGETRDPLLSVILPSADGGAFISTNTDFGAEVLASLGVNDVLAELVFDASSDAEGTFEISLGPGSALSTALGESVPFDSTPLSITVIPEPATILSLVLGAGILIGPSRRRIS